MAAPQLNKLKVCLVELAALRGLQFNSLCCQLKSEITTTVISSEFPDLRAPGRGRGGLFTPSQWLTLSWEGWEAEEVIQSCELGLGHLYLFQKITQTIKRVTRFGSQCFE